MINATVCIPLFSGVGNVLQSIPFISAMCRRYKTVTAYWKSPDYPQSVALVGHMFKTIYPRRNAIPKAVKVFNSPTRRSFPEWKGWFVDNGEECDGGQTRRPAYIPYHRKYPIVFIPEAKENWPCKAWPWWVELVNRFKNVAVVGLQDKPQFQEHVRDLRGGMLLGTGGILKRARIVIGNEGGLIHYASALGVKTVTVYGATDPVKNAPWGGTVVVQKGLDCQPCQYSERGLEMRGSGKNQIFHGCDHKRCLTTLTPREVYKVIQDTLK